MRVLLVSAVLGVLVAANVWVHVGPRRAHLVTQPVAAVLLVLLGRLAGLSWADLGLAPPTARVGVLVGLAGAVLVAAGYALALAIPALGGAFLDTRYDVRLHRAVWISAVDIPLSTVLLEETAFRGVVWGLVAVERGPVAATLVSSVLFGLWHVLPALDLARTQHGDRRTRPLAAAHRHGRGGDGPGHRGGRSAVRGVAGVHRQPAGTGRHSLGGQRDRGPRLCLGVAAGGVRFTRPG